MPAAPADHRPVAGRALLIGLGASNEAVAERLGSEHWKLAMVADGSTDEQAAVAASLGVEVRDMAWALEAVGDVDLVVPSPGVAPSHPVALAAAAAGTPVRGELALAMERTTTPVVAITGTNGKTTVTTLVAAMLEASGASAIAAGNIGLPMLEAATSGAEVVVAEVSSFQLHWAPGFHPRVGTWLNLAEDHLDWHGTIGHYRASKAAVWAALGPGDVAVAGVDDPVVREEAARLEGPEVVTFGIAEGTAAQWTWDRGRYVLCGPAGDIVRVDELQRRLPLDLLNALAAAATAVAAGATVEGCARALRAFAGLPHRLERVDAPGPLAFYDDSKSTTPASTVAACSAFRRVVAILGGRNKGMDLRALREAVPTMLSVVAIGEAQDEIDAALSDVVPVRRAASMEDAVAVASELAQSLGGADVLLSPACTSWDRYRNYAERGEDFVRAVRRLTGADSGGLGDLEGPGDVRPGRAGEGAGGR